MKNELYYLALVVVALAGLAVTVWRRYATPAALEGAVRDLMPDGVTEEMMTWAVMIVYKAVEQRMTWWDTNTPEEKLKLARSWLDALLEWRRTGQLNVGAKEALLEYEVFNQNDKAAAA